MKILALDDHSLFRDGLRFVLQSYDDSIELLEAVSFDMSLAIIEEHDDLALFLIDLELPSQSGFEVLEYVVKHYQTLPCVILSASTKRTDVERALKAGAMGFISKNAKGQSLYNAIKLVLSGEVFVPYDIMFTERRVNREQNVNLSKRQQQVMSLIKKGLPNKLIASQLSLSESTVKMHVSAIFEKLQVNNRVAALAAISEQNISLPHSE